MKTYSEQYEESMQRRCRNRSHVKITLTSGLTTYTFTDKDIASCEKSADVDPLSRRVPKENFSFSLFDFAGEYNPANPSGKWASLDENAKITAYFGYESISGTTEWLYGDEYYLDAKPTVSSGIATFKCSSKLCHLTKTYYKGTYGTKTFYAMAVDVLTDAGIGSFGYSIDSALLNYASDAPIPVTTHLNALQMIAHATCSTLRTVNGVIRIEPFNPNTMPPGLIIGLDSVAYRGDRVTKIETLYKVQADMYSFAKEAQSTELSSFTIDCDQTGSYHAEYDESADQSITVSSGSVTASSFYANACDFTLSGSGLITVTITGKKLKVSTSTAEAVVSQDASGATDTEKNRLITSQTMQALLIYQATNYLRYRMTHTVSYRGNPELEALDGVFLKTVYERYIAGIVLTHCISFSGAIKGEMMLKAVTEVSESYLVDANEEEVFDCDNQRICTVDISSYQSAYTAEDIDDFISAIL